MKFKTINDGVVNKGNHNSNQHNNEKSYFNPST